MRCPRCSNISSPHLIPSQRRQSSTHGAKETGEIDIQKVPFKDRITIEAMQKYLQHLGREIQYSFFLKIRLSSRGVLTQGAQAPAGVTVSKLFQTGVDQGMVATCANRRPAVVSFLLVPQPKIASDSENNKKQVAVFFSILH